VYTIIVGNITIGYVKRRNKMIHGIDISAYQDGYKLNFADMVSNGIGFVIIKGGQGAYTEIHNL
jgi:GH25 family lysozyme M1 (1,4-beta-N-acetylmuramidase)